MSEYKEPWTINYWDDQCECPYEKDHDEKKCSNKIPQSIEPCGITTDCGHYGPSHKDAERIVACVNACAGIPSDELESVIAVGVHELYCEEREHIASYGGDPEEWLHEAEKMRISQPNDWVQKIREGR